MAKRTISKLLLTSVLACAASASQAALVDDWGFVLDMQWDTSKKATTFTKGDGDHGISSTEIWWGSDKTAKKDKKGKVTKEASYFNSDPEYARSGIEITKPNVSGNIATSYIGETPNTAAANIFSHYNSEISGSFETLKSATLDVSIQLYLPGTNDVVQNITEKFDVHFYETPNVSGNNCKWGKCSSDIFAVISEMDLTKTFTYDGQSYTLSYFETDDDKIAKLSAGACKELGFSAGSCYGFTTAENNTTNVMFNFSITTAAVPEPETWAMLLAGLGMVGATARRRRNAIRN